MLSLIDLFSTAFAAALVVILSSSYSAVAASDVVPPPLLGKLVDVGGYRVHLYCTGAGSPVVMVVGGGFSFDWGLVQPNVAEFTRICTYDPSGTAWSDPFQSIAGPNGVVSQRMPKCAERVKEIHKLLENASINGPYVLAGFSIGGLFARLYANSYPEEVAGMVIIDHAFIDPGGNAPPGGSAAPKLRLPPGDSQAPLSPAQVDTPPILISKTPITLGIEDDENFRKLPQRDQDLHMWAMSNHPLRPTAESAAECIAAVASATDDGPYPLGNTPLVVVNTLNESPNYGKLQAKLLSLSHDSRRIVARNSSHMVIVDEPEIIVSAIREVVEAARRHTSLR